MSRIITIELFGEQHKFKAEADDANADLIINYLENKVDEAGSMMASPGREVNKFAQLLLATLNISNECFEMKLKYEEILKQIDERSSNIVDMIDETLMDD